MSRCTEGEEQEGEMDAREVRVPIPGWSPESHGRGTLDAEIDAFLRGDEIRRSGDILSTAGFTEAIWRATTSESLSEAVREEGRRALRLHDAAMRDRLDSMTERARLNAELYREAERAMLEADAENRQLRRCVGPGDPDWDSLEEQVRSGIAALDEAIDGEGDRGAWIDVRASLMDALGLIPSLRPPAARPEMTETAGRLPSRADFCQNLQTVSDLTGGETKAAATRRVRAHDAAQRAMIEQLLDLAGDRLIAIMDQAIRAEAAEARIGELEEACEPVVSRMERMLMDDLCDCPMDGGVHVCGRPDAQREVESARATLRGEESS